MEITVTAYLHFGDKLLPKGFYVVPRAGEIVELRDHGRFTVMRVELDPAGDSHLYLEPGGASGGVP